MENTELSLEDKITLLTENMSRYNDLTIENQILLNNIEDGEKAIVQANDMISGYRNMINQAKISFVNNEQEKVEEITDEFTLEEGAIDG